MLLRSCRAHEEPSCLALINLIAANQLATCCRCQCGLSQSFAAGVVWRHQQQRQRPTGARRSLWCVVFCVSAPESAVRQTPFQFPPASCMRSPLALDTPPSPHNTPYAPTSGPAGVSAVAAGELSIAADQQPACGRHSSTGGRSSGAVTLLFVAVVWGRRSQAGRS